MLYHTVYPYAFALPFLVSTLHVLVQSVSSANPTWPTCQLEADHNRNVRVFVTHRGRTDWGGTLSYPFLFSYEDVILVSLHLCKQRIDFTCIHQFQQTRVIS